MEKKPNRSMFFDEYGNLKESLKTTHKFNTRNIYKSYYQNSPIPRQENDSIVHFRLLSKLNKQWMSFNPEARFHIKAVSGCILCFSVVFFPSLYFEDRIEIIESRAKIDPLFLKKSNLTEFRRKKYGYTFDPFFSFVT